MARYRFIRSDNKIICLSTYAKKVVRGIAKCSPRDEFNLEIGEKLAQLRCDAKVAEKRMNRAYEKYKDARDYLFEARDYFDSMSKYYDDSCKQYDEATHSLFTFEKNV